jgi:cobalt-precorrin-5B (C1)-methyltransferase
MDDGSTKTGGKAKRLKSGFTTGTAAAAAAKGALLLLLDGRAPAEVAVDLPGGETLSIPVHACGAEGKDAARCTVIKDAGDDPDVTHMAEIGACVRLGAALKPDDPGDTVSIAGGTGVGRVTKPGLAVAPGEPAINPIPLQMIRSAITGVLEAYRIARRVSVEIFVPRGETLARKTMNARLGILGGISILGTTGIVRPMSHAAYTATIASALSVARASGLAEIVLTTGRRSERLSRPLLPELPEEAFVQMGDFFEYSLKEAVRRGFGRIVLAVFFGKAVKMAQGAPQTHASRSRLSLSALSALCVETCGDREAAEQIRTANTARQALDILKAGRPEVIAEIGSRMLRSAARFSGKEPSLRGIIFDSEGDPVYDAAAASGKDEKK